MVYNVSPKDIGEIRLNESDTVTQVLQNIAIILSTRQQSVPLGRTVGLPMTFLDKPISIAQAIAAVEIRDALLEQEPRATLVGVTFITEDNNPGKLIPTVEVEITDEQ